MPAGRHRRGERKAGAYRYNLAAHQIGGHIQPRCAGRQRKPQEAELPNHRRRGQVGYEGGIAAVFQGEQLHGGDAAGGGVNPGDDDRLLGSGDHADIPGRFVHGQGQRLRQFRRRKGAAVSGAAIYRRQRGAAAGRRRWHGIEPELPAGVGNGLKGVHRPGGGAEYMQQDSGSGRRASRRRAVNQPARYRRVSGRLRVQQPRRQRRQRNRRQQRRQYDAWQRQETAHGNNASGGNPGALTFRPPVFQRGALVFASGRGRGRALRCDGRIPSPRRRLLADPTASNIPHSRAAPAAVPYRCYVPLRRL